MHICAPKNKWELADMLRFAVDYSGPFAVRYPRGTAYDGLKEYRTPIELGKAEWIYKESGIVLLAVGSMVKTAEAVRNRLKEKGYSVSLVNARFVKPIDGETVKEACDSHELVVTMEENVAAGGYGEKVLDYMNRNGYRNSVLNICIPDAYIEHGDVEVLKKETGIDADSIVKSICALSESKQDERKT